MATAKDEKLELRYVPLDTVALWDRNPKKHDYGAIVESIKKYGFKDPPKFEPVLNDGKGGIVEGNGRSVALKDMFMNDEPMPRGIIMNGKGWLVPVLFGVDAESKQIAEAYALDHNSITLLGGDFGMYDLAKLYDEKVYADLLKDLQDADLPPVSMDYDDIGAFLNMVANGGEMIGPENQAEAKRTLQERFIVPPFSVLDARQGYWQNRKRAWIALGIQSELGRGDTPSTSARSDTPTYSPIRRRIAPGDGVGGGKQIKMAMANDPMQRKNKYDDQAGKA